jgi:hypothetical protein
LMVTKLMTAFFGVKYIVSGDKVDDKGGGDFH